MKKFECTQLYSVIKQANNRMFLALLTTIFHSSSILLLRTGYALKISNLEIMEIDPWPHFGFGFRSFMQFNHLNLISVFCWNTSILLIVLWVATQNERYFHIARKLIITGMLW